MNSITVPIIDTDRTTGVEFFFDQCGNLYFQTGMDQWMVSFDQSNRLVLEKMVRPLTVPFDPEYDRLFPHINSLRKQSEKIAADDEDDSDEEAIDYYPEDSEYTTRFNPYDETNEGFFGTEHVDLTDETVHFTSVAVDTAVPVRLDENNDAPTLYETIIYRKGVVSFKTVVVNSIPCFRLLWHQDGNRLEFKPTGSPSKTFQLKGMVVEEEEGSSTGGDASGSIVRIDLRFQPISE